MKAIIICLMLILCKSNGQQKWNDYVGIYYLDSVNVPDYENFYSFKLEPGDYWRYLDTNRCSAHWWTIDSVKREISIDINLIEVYLQNDSLFFRTMLYYGEQYIFSGRFKIPAIEFPEHLGEIILEGELIFIKKGTIQRRAKAYFSYDYGGC